MAVSFYLKNPSHKVSPIYVSFRYDGNRIQSSLKWKIQTRYWNKSKGLPKSQMSAEEYQGIMDHLNRSRKIIEAYYYDNKSKGHVPSEREIKQHLQSELFDNKQPEYEVSKNTSLKDWLDYYLKENPEMLRPGTQKKYRTLLNRLNEYVSEKMIVLEFDSIDQSFEESFKMWLLNYPKKFANSRRETGMIDETLNKYIGCLKHFMKWSHLKGLHTNTKYADFKTSKIPSYDKVVLTVGEIEALKKIDLSEHQDQIRDLFLFMYCTAQRWSDAISFNKYDLKGDVWHLKQKKTGTKVEVPLNGFAEGALRILEKYDYMLPKISDPYFNRQIKIICKKTGITSVERFSRSIMGMDHYFEQEKWELVSAHTARHSAITALLNNYKVPATIVRRISGHRNLKTLLKYENATTEDLRRALIQAI